MAKKPSKQTGKKSGKAKDEVSIPAQELSQGDSNLYLFKMKASELWSIVRHQMV